MALIHLNIEKVHIDVHYPASSDSTIVTASKQHITMEVNLSKQEIKTAIKAAADAEREQIRADIETAITEGLKKLGWTTEDRDEVLGIINEVYTPAGTSELKGVRFEVRFSAKGKELITQPRVYHDTPQATAEAVSALVIAPFVAALDAKVEAGDGKGDSVDVTLVGLTDGTQTAGKTWTKVPLEALILAEIAANEGEHGILLQDLEKVRAS